MQPPAPVLTTPLFPEERAALLAVLTNLAPEQWQQSTICPGWSVKDIAAHIIGDDLGRLSRQRDGFFATQPASGEDILTLVNRINGEWVQALRRLSSQVICALLATSGQALFDVFAAADPLALGDAVSWAGPDPAPVWLDIAREYTERWVHQQQIRDALGLAGLTTSHFLAPVLATFAWALPKTFATADMPPGTGIELHIRGASGGTWTLIRERATWVLCAGAAPQPTTHVVMHEDLAWRLFTKGVTPGVAEPDVQITGDYQLGRRLLDTVAIIA